MTFHEFVMRRRRRVWKMTFNPISIAEVALKEGCSVRTIEYDIAYVNKKIRDRRREIFEWADSILRQIEEDRKIINCNLLDIAIKSTNLNATQKN